MNKAGKLFLRGLLKSFIGVALVLGIAVLSYHFASRLLYFPKEEKHVATAAYEEEKEKLTTASVDDISKNLIFCVDEQGEIKKLLLELFLCEQRKMYYLTIPIETGITMSDSLYKKLTLVNPSVPQILKLSAITRHLPEETVYEYGVLLVEELLDLKMSYYTLVPVTVYDQVFRTEEPAEDGKGETAYPREIFSEDFLTMMHNIRTEEELKAYLEDIYEEIDSNLSVEDKMNYLDSYLKLTPAGISFELLAGEKTNSAYVADKGKISEQLARMTGRAR